MSLTVAIIEELAPDQASLTAASKLLKPAKWPLRETDGDYIWAECQGSGANPYRTIFDLRDHGYKCTCPSRKFPCKHALAMGLMFAEAPGDFAQGQIPEWGSDWIGRRRKTNTAAPKDDDNSPKPAKSLARALADEPEKPQDPKKAAALEAARQTRAKATKAAQMAGLVELESWVSDNLALGLPQVLTNLPERCRTISARLSDAKAATLSGRLDDIPERVMSVPQTARADTLIEELGKLVLLSRAAQTEPQPTGVQRLISAAESRESLLEDISAPSHQAVWQVVASHTRTRKDGLVSYSTWLLSCEDQPRFAQLLDFVPAALGKRGAGFSVGDIFSAELCYFPSPFALRAVIKERTPAEETSPWSATSTPPVADQVACALRAEPWLQDIPVLLGPGRVGTASGGATYWSGSDGERFPIHQQGLSPIAFGLSLHSSAAILRHGRLLLMASQTDMGVLYYDE